MRRFFNRSTISSVALLVALYLFLFNRFGPEKFHGIVWKLRRPGQMTVIEALAMEMETMKPPEGPLPVITEIVKPNPFEVAVTYTGTVAPLNEEFVIARVTGRLTWMPYYAGDRIQKGQIVAKLDNAGGEYAAREQEAIYGTLATLYERQMAEAEREQFKAQKRQAQAMVQGAKAMKIEAEKMAAEKQAMIAEAQSMAQQAEASVKEAERNLQLSQAQQREAERMVTALESELKIVKEQIAEAGAELEGALQEVNVARQELAMAQADLNYWQAEIERAKTLYERKAISKEELQREQAQFETAQAKVKAAEAKVRQAQAMVRAAEAKKRQGQNLLKQKEEELEAVKERVKQAQAIVEMAKEKLEQMKAMAQAAQAKVQQTRSAFEAAQARAKQAEAEVARAQAMVQEVEAGIHRALSQVLRTDALKAQMEAALKASKIVRGYTEIRSLTDGYVVERLASPGTLVTAGTPILRIAQLDYVRVQAFVSEKDLPDIKLGTPIIIEGTGGTEQETKSNSQIVGKVTAIFPAVEPTTRTGLVEAIVPNTGHRTQDEGQGQVFKLLPGQSVIIKIVKRLIPNAITVPNEAITQFEGQPAVWVAVGAKTSQPTEYTCPMHPEVRSDKLGKCPKCGMDLVPTKRQNSEVKTAQIRLVHLGETDGQRRLVLHGLRENDEVIVRGWQPLKEGTPVTAIREGELPQVFSTSPAPQGFGHRHSGR